ncbi:MAG: 30S ribosomal protein S12 methylthiotransferase RimO [Planctomycetota bacterium]|nr:30S ribosomal protein S12 methylthiotransferase RimO [Planctomycetota bacterium]
MHALPIVDPTEVEVLRSAPQASRGNYAFVSLGCPKNLVDSETMLGTLALDGYTLVSEPTDADFVIVNTCGFIESSRQESRDVIEEMLELKRQGKTRGVIVSGCLPERVGGDLLKQMPEIDHIVGVFGRDEIGKVADRFIGGLTEQRELFRPAPIKALDDRSRMRLTPAHFAYLKISEGCDRTCTFCSIPKMRGKHVTKPIEMVVQEARELVADGVRELILVAQDTTYYGMDLYGEVRLTQLLKELEQVDGLDWIRLMYLYPVNFNDELIETIATSKRIIPYLDMPLQHINDQVLKRMQRRVNGDQTKSLVQKLRASIPNLVLRTTFVVGFPGETDAQFAELKDFVRETRFERLGVFTYSLEPGTPAIKLDGRVSQAVMDQRRDELMALQQGFAFEFGESLVGYELDAIIDEEIEDGLWQGRVYADAPEIDGVVYVTGEQVSVGDIVPVEIVERREYDLVAVAVDPETADEETAALTHHDGQG